MSDIQSRRAARWTIVLASAGVLMTALDTLVVTTVLPVLREELGASLADLEWTVNAYNLAFACCLLTGAALGDRFGRRRMFTVGLGVFSAASVAAALAPDAGVLIVARAVQGAGAAILMPLTLTLISEAFPAEKRGAAIGIWGGIVGLGVAAGPLVGGLVADGMSWQWIFWINVPIGVALIPLSTAKLRESFGANRRLDIPGLVLAGLGFFGMTWGLVRAGEVGWTSAEVLAAMAVGALLVAIFLAWERRAPAPMVPLALFRSRDFSSANTVGFFMYGGLFGALFLFSQLLQVALGYSPLEAGVRLLPWTLPPMFIAPVAGVLADRFGNRPFMVLGLALQALGYAWVAARAEPGMGYAELGAAFTLAGIGTSFCFPTVANAVMGSVAMEQAGVASGVNSSLRELGGVFGVAVLASAFAGEAVFTSPRAFIDGFTTALWIGVGLSALGMLAALLTRPPAHADAALVMLEGARA